MNVNGQSDSSRPIQLPKRPSTDTQWDGQAHPHKKHAATGFYDAQTSEVNGSGEQPGTADRSIIGPSSSLSISNLPPSRPDSPNIGSLQHQGSEKGDTAITSDPSSQSSNASQQPESCFGMVGEARLSSIVLVAKLILQICDIGVRLSNEIPQRASDISSVRVSASGDRFSVLNLSFEESRCDLLSEAGIIIATLNTKTFNQLHSLQEAASLSWEGLVPTQILSNSTNADEKASVRKVVKINLNVYGSPEASEEVARELSRNELFLQDPECIRENSCYENPQFLKIPTEEIASSPGAEQPLREDDQRLNDARPSLAESAHEQTLILTEPEANFEFDRMIDHFAQRSDLQQAYVDPRVRTNLLESVFLVPLDDNSLTTSRYQRKGLDFVVKRESLSSLESSALWEPQENGSTLKVYAHVVGVSEVHRTRTVLTA